MTNAPCFENKGSQAVFFVTTLCICFKASQISSVINVLIFLGSSLFFCGKTAKKTVVYLLQFVTHTKIKQNQICYLFIILTTYILFFLLQLIDVGGVKKHLLCSNLCLVTQLQIATKPLEHYTAKKKQIESKKR